MATSKQFELAGIGPVLVSKRRVNHSVRLSIKADGSILVTIPAWASYQTGLDFANSRYDWIRQQLPQKTLLRDGQPVGKYHHLQLSPTQGLRVVRSVVTKTAVVVRYPAELHVTDSSVQTAAETACIRALRAQASQLLPQRLEQLATQHDLHFSEVRIKRMTSRWGSCDQNQKIVLNLFLMQLPWECIDYVLVHELTHTVILRHGPPFWDMMRQLIPNLAVIRQQMRAFQPILY